MHDDRHQNPLLRVEDLRIRFEGPGQALDALKGVNWDLYPGEILCVVGESGSGKTVMTQALMGLVSTKPGIIGGQITANFEGQDIPMLAGLEAYLSVRGEGDERRHRLKAGWQRRYKKRVQETLVGRIGMIFQNPRNALDPLWSVGKQLIESVAIADPSLTGKALKDAARDWLRRVHIDKVDEVFALYPHELSGGMCQRVAIAQILALQTPVVIADEPTTGLDATIQAGILDLIKEVQRDYNLSVLLITHDFGVVERLADRILVLFKGEQIEIGDADRILAPGAKLHPYTQTLLNSVRALEMGDLYGEGEG